MTTYVIRRLLLLIPVLLGVSFLVFAIAKITPGDPAILMLGVTANPEMIAKLHAQLHLDDPVMVQYGRFLWGALHGDFGTSFRSQFSVMSELLERLPNTLQLTVAAVILSTLIGLPAGLFAAMNKGKFIDKALMVSALTGLSVPTFWLAIILIIIFAVKLHWISTTGDSSDIKNLILPAFCLSVGPAAVLARLTRASIMEVMREDYVRTARGKGQREDIILVRHILRNALIPIVTYLGLLFADLLGGAVFVENVFARAGVGRYIVNAIVARDFPQVQGSVLFVAMGYVLVNLLVDLLYGVINPRVTFD
jgi:peptide/nickel transport system permease protein